MNFTNRVPGGRSFGGNPNNLQVQGGRPGSFSMQQNGARGNFTMQRSAMPYGHQHSVIIPATTTILVWTLLIFAIITLAKNLFAGGFEQKRCCTGIQESTANPTVVDDSVKN